MGRRSIRSSELTSYRSFPPLLAPEIFLYCQAMGTASRAARDAERPATTLTAPYGIDHGPRAASPSSVGRYQIRELLGAGAMGAVYRAHDPDLGRAVAIKLVRDGHAIVSSHLRLLREAQAMARLR